MFDEDCNTNCLLSFVRKLRSSHSTLLRGKQGKSPGDLYTDWMRPPTKRQWEEERHGAMGERRWDYGAVMENTKFRYMKKAMAARRVREIARERQCNTCHRYSFDAMVRPSLC
jgi:hypothetical protein